MRAGDYRSNLDVAAGVLVPEAIGDAPLAAFLKRMQIMDGPMKTNCADTGLWAWTRHPNYFGTMLGCGWGFLSPRAKPHLGWGLDLWANQS